MNINAVNFDNSYARLPKKFYSNVLPTPVKKPNIIKFNTLLARDLGLQLNDIEKELFLSGNSLLSNSIPIAMAYAGHQFGHWVPQLGDGRAILLGEIIDKKGFRRDIQLKGCGPTPYSRMGDGRAWLGPILREYILSEAMNNIGIPTTRALSAISTGETVYREKEYPGAILTRVAYSHVRVGTFQYFASRKDLKGLKILADYIIKRHYKDCEKEKNPYLSLLKEIIKRQADLVSKWMGIGFIHGVLNTDNTSIYGETIDYGPCAFMDEYDSNKVFSSIDQAGRYAYKNQPEVIRWNLACLASCLLPLINEDEKKAVILAQSAIDEFPNIYNMYWLKIFRNKLGLRKNYEDDINLINDLLDIMEKDKTDFTLTFRAMSTLVNNDKSHFKNYFLNPNIIENWIEKWKNRLLLENENINNIINFLNKINPAYIPRNHRVEEIINEGLKGDYSYFERLNKILTKPFDNQNENVEYQIGPNETQRVSQTFCGT